MTFRKIIIFTFSALTLVLWPVNLYLKNTLPDFIIYLIPAILIVISYFLYSKKSVSYIVPIMLIPFFEKKFLILPLIFIAIEIYINFKKGLITLFITSLVLFFWNFTYFKNQTVFNRDYEGEQLLIRNIHLYPNIPLARTFQNKPKLYLSKVSDNFFSLIDLNNYFFAGHPAPTIINTQELYKFYWPLLIFLLLGVYNFKEYVNKNYVLTILVSSIISLSLLQNFDRHDFILWFPISLIIIYGIKKIFR